MSVSSNSSIVAVVTGATGFVATELVGQLLDKGYTVRGTVRNRESEASKLLLGLFTSLKLYEADLLKDGSFDEVVKGAQVVFHTASPFPAKIVDPQTEVIDPALNGTKNVLSSVEKNLSTITCLVVTGSGAAVVEHTPTDDGTKLWNEDDWNTTSTLTEGPYRLSKVLAEKYVWEWADKHPSVKVATILPTFVVGPPRSSRSEATSIKVFKELLDGTSKKAGGVPPVCFGGVDVRDIGRAHIAAFEKPNAKGRFLLSSEKGISRLQYAKILKKAFPQLEIPELQNGELVYRGGSVINGGYDNRKSKEQLGIEYTSIDRSVVEMAQKLIELGIVKI